MFQWTNLGFCDLLCGDPLNCAFANIIRFQGKIKILAVTFAQMAEIYLIGYLAILPFTLQFDTMIDGCGIAKYHSYFYQLMVLWGTSGSAAPSPFVSMFGKAAQNGKFHTQKPVPSYEGHAHGRPVCHYHGTLRHGTKR